VSPVNVDAVVIGSSGTGGNAFDGAINHAQIHSVDRPVAWIKYEYDQVDDQATFWGTWTNVEAAGGGSGLWTPAELGASLAMWLDADDAATISPNGSTVSNWADKSGNQNDVSQATLSAQPLYSPTGFNSKPSVFFDASNDAMACATTNVSSQGDLFFGAAFQMLSGSAIWRPIVGTNTSVSNSNAGTLILQRMNNRSEVGVHDSGRTDTGNTYAVQVTDLFEPRIATVGRNGGTNGNGGTITVTATGPSQPTYITQATQTWITSEATSRIQIGGRQQIGTGWANAYISEVIVCNADLSTEDRQKLEGYLAWKWGLESDLPIDHPYKAAAPNHRKWNQHPSGHAPPSDDGSFLTCST